MTNINCSSNCFFQKEGKCTFSDISQIRITPDMECVYFKEKSDKFNNTTLKS